MCVCVCVCACVCVYVCVCLSISLSLSLCVRVCVCVCVAGDVKWHGQVLVIHAYLFAETTVMCHIVRWVSMLLCLSGNTPNVFNETRTNV